MGSLSSWLIVAHVIGLSLAVGSASAKLTLLAKCRTDHAFVPVFIAIARPVTRLIILGLILVTLSGVGWLLLGYPFTSTLIVKLVMVGVIWVLGPVIDNVAEPRFKKSAPAAGQSATPEFTRAWQHYFALEVVATALFYAIIVMWLRA